MKLLKRTLLIFAIAVPFVVVGLAWLLSSFLMYPVRYPCTLARETRLYVYCKTPRERGVPFETVRFRSSDGVPLHGWYIKAAGSPSDRLVVVAHGRSAGRWAINRYLPALPRAGFNVLAFDFRYHGQSGGQYSTLGYQEQRDLRAAVDLGAARGNRRIGVFGFSMGAATAILTMARDPRIQAGIFESPYANFTDLIRAGGKRRVKPPPSVALEQMLRLFEWRTGAVVAHMHPERVIASIAPRPILLIHGARDRIIHVSHSKRLYAAAGANKRLWILPEGDHVNSWNVNRKRTEREVLGFFRKHL